MEAKIIKRGCQWYRFFHTKVSPNMQVMKRIYFDSDGGNGGKGLGGHTDPDTTHGDNDVISPEGVDGTTEADDGVFSDEGLDEPGGTSGADSGTGGLARDDE
jgi:hypothetical protein